MVYVPARGRHRVGGLPNSSNDSVVGSAPADIPFESLFDFALRGRRCFAKQGDTRQNHARRAISALHGIALDERFLNRMQSPGVSKTFYRQDLPTRNRAHRRDARTCCRSVDEYSTRTTLPLTTTVFDSSEIEMIAEYVQKGGIGRNADLAPLAVDHKIHPSILVPFLRGVVELMEAHDHAS